MSGSPNQSRKFCITPHQQQQQLLQQRHLLLQQQQQQLLARQQQMAQRPRTCVISSSRTVTYPNSYSLTSAPAALQQQDQQQAMMHELQHMQQQHQQHQQQEQQQQQQQQQRLQQQRQRQTQQQQPQQHQQQQQKPDACGTTMSCGRTNSKGSSGNGGGGGPCPPVPPTPPPRPDRTNPASRYNMHKSKNDVTSVTSSAHLLSQQEEEQQLRKQCAADDACNSGDSAKINCKLNEIFVKRLQEIDCQAEGDADLKLMTYQEWIEMLLKINENIINNMQDLEEEVSERLEVMQRKAASHSSQASECAKYQKDICTLLKVIQNGYHNDNWDIQSLEFETLSHEEILGLCNQQSGPAEGSFIRQTMDAEEAQRNKLIANMKALAIEVAEKHDEVRELKKQMICMEDEIQNAQMKIQLKDDVIRELRNDLKVANAKLCSPINTSSGVTLVEMPPINLETARSAGTQVSDGLVAQHHQLLFTMNDDSSQFESLSNTEQLEQQKLKVLEEELNELFEMTKDMKKQNYEFHKKRLSDIFQKSESEKTEAYRKLDFIRRQLTDLEAKQVDPFSNPWNECDSGFSSKSENDKDAKILDGVRKRIRKLNECSFELKKKVQQLEIENNELSSKLQTEKAFVGRNAETLKQVADLLCDMTGEQFSYNDIYNVQCKGNPFCEAILDLERTRQQREDQLCKKMRHMEEALYNNEQEISELTQRISNSEMTNKTHTTAFYTNPSKKPTALQKDTQQRKLIVEQESQRQQQHKRQQPVDNHNRESNSNTTNTTKATTTSNNCSAGKSNSTTNTKSSTDTHNSTATNTSTNSFEDTVWNW